MLRWPDNYRHSRGEFLEDILNTEGWEKIIGKVKRAIKGMRKDIKETYSLVDESSRIIGEYTTKKVEGLLKKIFGSYSEKKHLIEKNTHNNEQEGNKKEKALTQLEKFPYSSKEDLTRKGGLSKEEIEFLLFLKNYLNDPPI